MKLKLDLSDSKLSFIFGTHVKKFSIFTNILRHLSENTKKIVNLHVRNFDCDATRDELEISVEMPQKFSARCSLYSCYKNSYSNKAPLRFDSRGKITHVNFAYCGRSKDSAFHKKKNREQDLEVATARIHTERAMHRLKSYKALVSLSDYKVVNIDNLIHLCCLIADCRR